MKKMKDNGLVMEMIIKKTSCVNTKPSTCPYSLILWASSLIILSKNWTTIRLWNRNKNWGDNLFLKLHTFRTTVKGQFLLRYQKFELLSLKDYVYVDFSRQKINLNASKTAHRKNYFSNKLWQINTANIYRINKKLLEFANF